VRLSVARGVTRTQFLAAKLLTTALVCAVGMLVALAVGVVFSLMATQLFEDPTKYVGVNPEPSVSEMPLMVARSALAILPYGMLAFMLAVLSRSTAMGATGVLAYKLIESTAVSGFGELGGNWERLQNLFIEHHASALLAVNKAGYPDYNTIAFRAVPDPADTPDPWLAVLMLVAFCIVFGAASFASFARRDLNSRE
jgi:ABC-type transport system involved in multi-copper enzyme maturation permease subunit